MADGNGGQADRGLSTNAGIFLFIAIGALMTASGAYLMLELGNQDIGQTATTALDAKQQGDTVIVEHSTGESVAGENIRVEGGRVGELPETVNSGTQFEVTPTEGEVVVFYEDGRVSQELVRADVDLTRLVVTVEDENGSPLANHPVGVYDLGAKPTIATPSNLLSAVEDGGQPPEPLFAGLTDEDGQLVTATTHRDGLERDGEYVMLAATTGGADQRTYAIESVQISQRDNEVRLVLSG